MTAPIKIGVLFNELENRPSCLKDWCRRYPEAYVVAVVPNGPPRRRKRRKGPMKYCPWNYRPDACFAREHCLPW